MDVFPAIPASVWRCSTGFLNGKRLWKTWRWAEVGEQGLRYNSDVTERVSKANTLVDLLEGK
jgi:hypothetical protein